jgi:hypothetical protein
MEGSSMAYETTSRSGERVRASHAAELHRAAQRQEGHRQNAAEPGTPAHWAAVLNSSPRLQSLKQLQRGLGSRSVAVAQRLAYSDEPYPDLAPRDSLTVNKSGAGTTGVYLAAENGQLAVVVKFLSKEEAFRAALGDKYMARGTGLVTPESKVIPAGEEGNRLIKEDLRAHATEDRPNDRLKREVADDTADPRGSVLLMSVVEHVSLKDLVKGRQGENLNLEHVRLTRVLSNEKIARDFAKIIVSDALLGNKDRFLKEPDTQARTFAGGAVNLSNIFVSGDLERGVALDNEVWNVSEATPENAFEPLKTAPILYVAQPTFAADIAAAVVRTCLYEFGEITDATWNDDYTRLQTPLARLLIPTVRNTLADNLAAAIPQEIKEVVKRLRKKKNELRKEYYNLARSSGYEDDLPSAKKFSGTRASQVADYNQLRARSKMLKKLAKNPQDENAAKEAAREHLQHKRDKEPDQV